MHAIHGGFAKSTENRLSLVCRNDGSSVYRAYMYIGFYTTACRRSFVVVVAVIFGGNRCTNTLSLNIHMRIQLRSNYSLYRVYVPKSRKLTDFDVCARKGARKEVGESAGRGRFEQETVGVERSVCVCA